MADKDGNISVASNSLAMILRYSSKKEVLGLNMAEKLYENKSDRRDFLKKLTQEGRVEGYPVNMVCKDGTRVVLSAHSTLLCDEKGEPIGVEGILEEVSQEKPVTKSKERPVPDLVPIDENAESNFDGLMKDPLTGLYNYQYFMICLNAEIKRVERLFHPTCLMMIDLDNFSDYNQKNGRPKGDELLKTVAGLLKENLRTTDILCRQAQDQFLAILLETKKDEAVDLVQEGQGFYSGSPEGQKHHLQHRDVPLYSRHDRPGVFSAGQCRAVYGQGKRQERSLSLRIRVMDETMKEGAIMYKDVINRIRQKAMQDPKMIIFPETEDLRVLKAVEIIRREGIAQPLLLAKEDMDLFQKEKFAYLLYECRKNKGMTLEESPRAYGGPAFLRGHDAALRLC